MNSAVVDRDYGNFFPYFTLVCELGESSKATLAYNRRITRPTFNDMAPFVFFAGPNTFFAGNLSLKPALTDGLEMTFKQKLWWVSLSYSYTKDAMAFMQPEHLADIGQVVYRSQNMNHKQQLGLSFVWPLSIAPWWEMQNDVSLYRYNLKATYLEEPVEQNTFNFVFNISNMISLPADFSVELSANYQTSPEWGIFQMKPLGQLNLGIRKNLSNGTIFSLVGTDLLNTYNWNFKSDVSYPDGHQERSQVCFDWGFRGIRFTFTMPFGNNKLKAINIKQGAEAERNRVQ